MVDSPAGTARPVTLLGADVLARPAAEVTVFDGALQALVADMFTSMYAAGGVGLAANQIGVGRRVFVIDCPVDRDDPDGQRLVGHVVNPVLRVLDATPHPGSEGCLSVPGPRAELPRPTAVEVTGVDCDGRPVRMVGARLAARCLEHETDHLAGRLYVERLGEPERRRVVAEHQATLLEQGGFAVSVRRPPAVR